MKTTRTIALLATALFAGGLVNAAHAITPVPGASSPATDTSLRLTVTHGETPTAGTPRAVLLDCPPDAATTHPDPLTACRLIDSVNGNIGELDVNPGACTQEYDPYTVTASGTYRGRPLSFHHTYGNHCTLLRATGAVYDF
ncbi:SSI family serine proteinase inhibitor [Kitasatospora sp. NPDC056327]|uniref:SSI family serine proteinase inhibitor n=1 Tax=Kitasatospora sp. NPDC056327 TaxID=3345785 RepID=UPI0035E1AFB0